MKKIVLPEKPEEVTQAKPFVKQLIYKLWTGNKYHAYLSNGKILDCYKSKYMIWMVNSIKKWSETELETVAETRSAVVVWW